MKDVITSNKSTGKGVGKGVPLSNAGKASLLPEAKDEAWQVKDFLLADAIPKSTMEETSDASESWRGFRRPKSPSDTQYSKRGGSSNWSWSKWNK